MILLTLLVIIIPYAAVAAWAYHTGGPARVWLTALGALAVVVALAVGIVTSPVMTRGAAHGPAVLYISAVYGVPVLFAATAVILTRGRVLAGMISGVVGFVLATFAAMFALWR